MIRACTTDVQLLRNRLRPRHFRTFNRSHGTQNIAQPSFWLGLIPKPLRKSSKTITSGKPTQSRQWNPATFFILIFILIGSMSVNMIAIRNDYTTFSRGADNRIRLLKEIVERVQKGEDVDVEKLLGTGDMDHEKEWQAVLEQIASDDQAWEGSRKPKPSHRRKSKNSYQKEGADGQKAESPVEVVTKDGATVQAENAIVQQKLKNTSGGYF